MKRFRVEKNKNYTTISNVFLRDKTLSLKAKGVLAMVMSLKDDWDFSIDGFVQITKEGESAIYSAIKELKEHGYCKEEKIRDDKKRIISNEYVFYEDPQTQVVDNQLNRENLDLGFPNQENQEQLSTTNIYINNKLLNKIKEKEDIIISSKKKTKAKDVLETFDCCSVPKEYIQVIRKWCEYKRERKQRYATQSSFNTMVKRLIKLSEGSAMKADAIVEQSIANNYAGLFELRANNTTPLGFKLEGDRTAIMKNEQGQSW